MPAATRSESHVSEIELDRFAAAGTSISGCTLRIKRNEQPKGGVALKTEVKHPPLDDDAFAERVRLNQHELGAALKGHYDFIVCGSGSSGSVVARRLAENSNVQVLLLEAGGWDNVPEVRKAVRWPANYASERNWNFLAQPSPHLNGRRMPLAMRKVLGGGSSINAIGWARGHKNDWDFFASEAGDDAWN